MLPSVEVTLIEAQESQTWGSKPFILDWNPLGVIGLRISKIVQGEGWSDEWRQRGNICMVKELQGGIGLQG